MTAGSVLSSWPDSDQSTEANCGRCLPLSRRRSAELRGGWRLGWRSPDGALSSRSPLAVGATPLAAAALYMSPSCAPRTESPLLPPLFAVGTLSVLAEPLPLLAHTDRAWRFEP